jgi:hypothetical protein
MSNYVNGSSSITPPDRPCSNEFSPEPPSSREPSSDRPFSELGSTRQSSSLRSTPEQQPHPADRVSQFYQGRDNKYGGIIPSDLVVQDPETRLSHLQYLLRVSPFTTSFVTDKTTIVATIQHEHRNDASGEPRRCWDISFGHGSEHNHCESFPVNIIMTDTCGDVCALIAALRIIKSRGLGAPLLSQVYIATDSETLVGLFTGPGERDESHVGE